MIKEVVRSLEELKKRVTRLELWESSAAQAWIAPGYESGWESYNEPTHYEGSYSRVGNEVRIRGMVKRTSGVGVRIIRLPADLYPARESTFVSLDSTGTCTITVDVDGYVNYSGADPSTWVSIDGIIIPLVV